MRIALVHGKYFNSWEALGLGYIGAYLKKFLPEAEYSFFQGCFDDDGEIVAGCSSVDFVLFSCTTPTFDHSLWLARRIKQENPAVQTVFGGYHPSAAPESCLREGVDYVVVGEGEDATQRIIAGFEDSGIVRARAMKFDELPWPDRHLIKSERNISVAHADTGLRITSFQSHRSCPYKCVYCLDGAVDVLYDHLPRIPFTWRPVEDLLDEMAAVSEEWRLDLAKFSDPTWNTNKSWVKDFCRAKIARGLAIPFYPNVHANVADAEMYRLMAEAGCSQVAMGVESGSPKVLKQIGKGTTVEGIERSVKWAREAGVKVRGYFIVGMPDETAEDLRLTYELADRLQLDEVGFSMLCPYPGTQIHNDAPERWESVDWSNADEYKNDFWSTPHFSNAELSEWQDRLAAAFRDKLTWHQAVLSGRSGSEDGSA